MLIWYGFVDPRLVIFYEFRNTLPEIQQTVCYLLDTHSPDPVRYVAADVDLYDLFYYCLSWIGWVAGETTADDG